MARAVGDGALADATPARHDLVQPRTADAAAVCLRRAAHGRRSDGREAQMTTVRAAMHAHSDWSYDAHVPLAQLASLFARRGYDAVFMCEHDRGFTAERKRAYDDACARASE